MVARTARLIYPLGTELQTEALACTDIDADPVRIIGWYLLRWRIEGTFQEVRAHLGVETQRQWSDSAIARTTPLLLGPFFWVALCYCSAIMSSLTVKRKCPHYGRMRH